MFAKWRMTWILGGIALSSWSMSQTAGGPAPDEYNVDNHVNRNFAARLEITRFDDPGMPITGTSEFFELRLAAGPDANTTYVGPDGWTSAQIISPKLMISDVEQSCSANGIGVVPETGLTAGSWSVHLSTTWLQPNSTPPIRFSAKIRFIRKDSNGQIVESEEDDLVRTVNPRVINRLVTVATRMSTRDVPSSTPGGTSYIFEDNLDGIQSKIARETMTEAQQGITNHEKLPASIQAAQSAQRDQGLTSWISLGTVLFATTHGLGNGFLDSYGYTVPSNSFLSHSDVAVYLQSNPNARKVDPAYHLVVMMVCFSMSASTGNAFGILNNGNTLPNRALVAYPQTLLTGSNIGSSQIVNGQIAYTQDQIWTMASFKDWMADFVSRLVAGHSVSQAVKDANRYFPITIHARGSRITQPMGFRGDPDARLYGLFGDTPIATPNLTKFRITP
ncbi:MAG TPA: hypothetical protein PLO61_03455 [Fimbriimonadaceae bacterium]|nr:hypothetical protein [Fimbriimonadaceae bacterium]HRJ32688.1 hypothetical protein [Fimbriimonadaceae bacterium]